MTGHGDLDVLNVLGPPSLTPKTRGEMNALLDRVRTQNTRRNRIVHGSWTLELRLFNWNGVVGVRRYQYRYYKPNDEATELAIMKGQSRDARSKYLFSISRIDALTNEMLRLATDLQEFIAQIDGRPKGSRGVLLRGGPLDPS